ncbi:MAG TPA: DNA/RNA nuclease SfsA [Spirochaetota bacterium]|nr:DNA/RNA nuclease SfsA [Spirochaetota bacterium]HPF06535.1 DNA/RNA nuclease SfsA [Spirochaetota bacterium]HPJ42954.1 DNA/RNA nuclease SfsA [Spirochaetota bacterium]HPR36378.1 DNA/RNA nuclease SfsA [Spirochaetota bacterium]HRX47780.1 DNA/RNA nuclease SfsA [Spirochaetota bacterium]
MKKTPDNLLRASLIKRNNRFVADVILNGKPETVYVPNTGRLSELALPGADVLLSPINGKYRYKILYIINDNYPVMIDSTYSNRLFQKLLIEKKVPGLEGFKLIRREPAIGNHRFDFLLEADGKEKFLELKSCTLFHNNIASFPDAVSERASEHVRLLAETGEGILVFLIFKHKMNYFIPNYHTDFTFYKTVKNCSKLIDIKALSIEYNDNLDITQLKEVPVLMPEVGPCGLFIILIKLNDSTAQGINSRYLLLCGIEKNDLFKRVKKLRSNPKLFPSIEGISFTGMKIITDLPVVTETTDISVLDYSLLNKDSDSGTVFSSDEWRVYSFRENPAEKEWFWDEILNLRFR